MVGITPGRQAEMVAGTRVVMVVGIRVVVVIGTSKMAALGTREAPGPSGRGKIIARATRFSRR